MMELTPHAVAYLDILGFSCFVEKAENDPEALNTLKKLFEEVIPREISLEGKNSDFPENLGLRCLSCSDSFVLSAPASKGSRYPGLIAVSIKSIQIAHALLDMGFLVRGAIAVGNVIYRTDSNILGTGFQEAVTAEKNVGNPKIVLTESAEKALNELIKEGRPRYAIYVKDELDQVILNSLHPEKSYLPDPKREITEYFGEYRKTILRNLSGDNHDFQEKVKEKWRWFAGLFEANVKYFSDLKMNISSFGISDELPIVTLNYLNPPSLDPDWFNSCKSPSVKIMIQVERNEDPLV